MERSTVGSLLRSTQGYCQQICEKQTFDFGIAFYSERFPMLPEANQIREVTLSDSRQIADAFEQTSAWFASPGLECFRWSPAIDIDAKALSDFLGAHGFVPRKLIAMRLSEWPNITTSPEVRVLPARAMRSSFVESFTALPPPDEAEARAALADSFVERLDDPQLDMFVATVDKKTAGRCGLYQVGDIARVLDLSVLPEFANRGVAESLLAHVLALARRLTMPMVVAQAAESDAARRPLLKSAGFVEDGEKIEFEIPSPFSAVSPV
jgi:ribosomal protein S18 acetylase RimI-like enzyme